jgi:hypothetical protein
MLLLLLGEVPDGSSLKQQWMIPPKENAAFVANMQDALDTYAKPYGSSRPVVCLDETGKQLIGEVREPLPVRPGSPEEARRISPNVSSGTTRRSTPVG